MKTKTTVTVWKHFESQTNLKCMDGWSQWLKWLQELCNLISFRNLDFSIKWKEKQQGKLSVSIFFSSSLFCRRFVLKPLIACVRIVFKLSLKSTTNGNVKPFMVIGQMEIELYNSIKASEMKMHTFQMVIMTLHETYYWFSVQFFAYINDQWAQKAMNNQTNEVI